MFRKPLFWIVLCAASLGGIYFTARYFSKAYPIVTLDLRMNRAEALASAADLASRLQLPPPGYRQAASFDSNQEVQNFAELEAGGTAAFQAMMAAGHFYPFQWHVRHFKPGESRETTLRFTPRGDPYGFLVKLPETEPGAALEAGSAREIAESSAAQDWRIEFARYRLVEQSREVRPAGRVDHTFVYERPDIQLGEGRYRLRIVVGGDRLSELTHFVKVPEAFSRRYAQMRAANDVVGVGGALAMALLYLAGGCGVGLFFLLRRRWIIWRTPLLWGLFIAFLQLLAGLNEWPLLWMSYDTAISAQVFVFQQILLLLLTFLGYTALFALSFMAAESLGRRAFPNHIQLWKLWSGDAAGTRAVLGRTLGGYLLVPIFFAYEVLLYFVAARTLGWWTPSDALVQPDVLATYFPWLTAIAAPAQAGFWEESLFRAVPIAGAALLGDRFGQRRWWIAGALVFQALIFGSGHAAYATQPFYARVVELILPSLMFAGLYIFLGLLPAIVLHFAFDVVWFALPLFVSAAQGIWANRILVAVLTFVPLWVVLGARWRAGKWRTVDAALLNRAWQPAPAPAPAAPQEQPVLRAMSRAAVRWTLVAGALGLLLWFWATSFKADAPALATGRTHAVSVAVQELERRGVHLSGSFRQLTAMEGDPDQQDRFVWQTAGKETYHRLMNEYLMPPVWCVRFARFEGDVAERAEEYQVFVGDAGRVLRFRHILPEAKPGNSIDEGSARAMALAAVQQEFQLNPASIKEVAAVPSKLKARTDWTFIFSAQGEPKLPQGERRVSVGIAGDQVADVYRFVHVPEEWDRQERSRQVLPTIISLGSTLLFVAVVAVGTIAAIVSWSRKRLIVSTFLLIFPLLSGFTLATLVNSIPNLTAQFLTAQPFNIQMFVVLGASAVGMIISAACLGLTAGLVHRWRLDGKAAQKITWVSGLALGCAAAGIMALASSLSPSLAPRWANYAVMNNYFPLPGMVLPPVSGYFGESIVVLLLFAAVDRFTNYWTRRRILFGALLLLAGFGVAGVRSVETIPSWLMQGAIIGVLLLASYWLILRYSLESGLIAVGVLSVLNLVRQAAFAAHPVAVPGAVIAAILIVASVWIWHRQFAGEQRERGQDG